jgi:hypothetical protein
VDGAAASAPDTGKPPLWCCRSSDSPHLSPLVVPLLDLGESSAVGAPCCAYCRAHAVAAASFGLHPFRRMQHKIVAPDWR